MHTGLDGRREDVWYDQDAGPVVRPYAVTRGRTQPVRGDFDLISLVLARRSATPPPDLGPEQAAILARCVRPLSVAEISAELDLPVGTVRVLLGDLLELGLIESHAPPIMDAPSDELLEAVLAGLRAL
ncbi:DUF742 domain-containing protein [Micromonospora sp. HM5-17]|uniref:DUF742 domain-containing protein n=1 Tax=Micromonospora sp. HM5-17 TaxID=2487710 RepID=UPI001F1E06BF|nr:DUF742 domain-containing protein [Micromonospora sp. HM5-17]